MICLMMIIKTKNTMVNDLFSKLFLLIPVFSSSILPFNASSAIIHPLKPDDKQSFQNDV